MKLQIGDKVELKRTIVDEVTDVSNENPWPSYRIHGTWWESDPRNENILTDDAGYTYLLRFIAAPEPPVKSVAIDKDGTAWVSKGEMWTSSDRGDRLNWNSLNSRYGPMHIVHVAPVETTGETE